MGILNCYGNLRMMFAGVWKKTAMISALMLFVSMTVAPVMARAESMPVAVVQLQEILRKSKASNAIREQIESTSEGYKNEVQSEEERLRNSEQELIQQRSLLSPDVYEENLRSFRDQVKNVQKDVQVKRSSLDRAYAEAMVQVQKTVSEIITELAEERGFKLAVPTASILYRDDSLDITPEVLSRLDQRLPSVAVNVKASAN